MRGLIEGSSSGRVKALAVLTGLVVAGVLAAQAAPAQAWTCEATWGGTDTCSAQCVDLVIPGGKTPAFSADVFSTCDDYWNWVFSHFTTSGQAPTQAPTITDGPKNGDSTGADVTFSFSSSESGVTGYQCQVDGQAWAVCASPDQLTKLAPGQHTFAVEALASGVAGPASPTVTWTVGIPTVITSGPSGTVDARSATFAFASSDPDATYQCQLDGGGWSGCNSPVTFGGLADGQHTFGVQALEGGQPGGASTSAWTVDTTPPKTKIDSGPDTLSQVTDATFTFSSTEAGSSFQCSLDGGPATTCVAPAIFQNLAPGSHTLAVHATDPAGNRDGTGATYTWTVAAQSSNGGPSQSSSSTSGTGATCSLPASRDVRSFHAMTFVDCAAPAQATCKAPDQAVLPLDAFVGQAIDGAACFHQLTKTKWASSGGRVMLNGITLTMPDHGQLIFDDAHAHVYTTVPPWIMLGRSAAAGVPDGHSWIPIFRSPVNLSFYASGQGNLLAPNSPLTNYKIKFFGATLRLTSLVFEGGPQSQVNGHSGAAKVGIELAFPRSLFGTNNLQHLAAGGGFEASLMTSNGAGLQGSVKFSAQQVLLFGRLEVDEPSFTYDSYNRHLALEGTIKVPTMPDLKLTVGGTLGGYLTVTAYLEHLNRPIGSPPVAFLQSLGGGWGVNSNYTTTITQNTTFSFGGSVTAGPEIPILGNNFSALKLTGTMTLGFANTNLTSSWPYFEFDGAGAIAGLQFAKGQLVWGRNGTNYSNRWAFSGHIQLGGLGLFGVTAEVRQGEGWIAARTFMLTGRIVGQLPFDLGPAAEIRFTPQGAVACGQWNGANVGFSFSWGTHRLTPYSNSCDIGALTGGGKAADRSARDAAAGQIVLPSGMHVAVIAVRGRGAVPQVIIQGPNGERITTSAAAQKTPHPGYLLYEDPATDTTTVLVAHPAGGRWTVTAQPGSAPLAAVQSADELPPVQVRARLTGRGSRRALLYTIRPIAGQQVIFQEDATGLSRTIVSTNRSAGRVAFTPAAGPPARRLVAYVYENGQLRSIVKLGRYRISTKPAPGPKHHRTNTKTKA